MPKITQELQAKITQFADRWLKLTGRESLYDGMQGFDYSIDCYRTLSEIEKQSISDTEFLDLLEKEINNKF